jgi:DNA-binding NarL/FixJ family response regulator
MDRPVRVLIAVHHPRPRYGLRALLATLPGVDVVAAAADGQQLLHLVEEVQPEVVLVDLQMPGLAGLESMWRVKERWPEIRVVALALYAGDRPQALAAGADGFLVKGCPAEEFAAVLGSRARLGTTSKESTPPVWKAALGGQPA